jgi:hypothetical protein
MKAYHAAVFFCILGVGPMQGAPVNNDAVEKEPIEKGAFASPGASSQVHTWWHWISGNVTKDGITKDLESMKQQGVSQATILNVGGFVGARLAVPNIKFDSPERYDMFHYSLAEAKRLGITIGVHNCDGWSTSGGPWVKPEHSMKEFVWTKTKVEGRKRNSIALDQPPTTLDFYRDVAVLAFPNLHPSNSYVQAAPTVKNQSSSISTILSDGNPLTKTKFEPGATITASFDTPFEADQLFILPHLVFAWDNMSRIPISFTLPSSIDGKTFSEIERIDLVGRIRFRKF